jgi:hypothetical protein
MARALLDIDCILVNGEPESSGPTFGRCVSALRAFGLRFVGTAPSPLSYDGSETMRLIVEDDLGRDILPAECKEGWRIIKVIFVRETHGDQEIVRVTEVNVSGIPRLNLAA